MQPTLLQLLYPATSLNISWLWESGDPKLFWRRHTRTAQKPIWNIIQLHTWKFPFAVQPKEGGRKAPTERKGFGGKAQLTPNSGRISLKDPFTLFPARCRINSTLYLIQYHIWSGPRCVLLSFAQFLRIWRIEVINSKRWGGPFTSSEYSLSVLQSMHMHNHLKRIHGEKMWNLFDAMCAITWLLVHSIKQINFQNQLTRK